MTEGQPRGNRLDTTMMTAPRHWYSLTFPNVARFSAKRTLPKGPLLTQSGLSQSHNISEFSMGTEGAIICKKEPVTFATGSLGNARGLRALVI